MIMCQGLAGFPESRFLQADLQACNSQCPGPHLLSWQTMNQDFAGWGREIKIKNSAGQSRAVAK